MQSLFLIKVFYFFILAVFLAMLEIQIEGGRGGWASSLPTWRAKLGGKLDKFFKRIFLQKDLTGYHLALNAFLLIFIHWPFVYNWRWDVWAELEVLAIFVLFAVIWDFLWFVLNPKFSLRKFNAENVWWHKKWLMGIPVDYWLGMLVSVLLLLPETLMLNPVAGLFKMLMIIGVNVILVGVTILIYPKAY